MLLLVPFFDTLKHWFREMLFWLFDLLMSVLEQIPAPEWFDDVGGSLAGITPEVAYFVGPMQIEYGISIILSAYLIRFIIRRIPIIG
ncbi:hypothetical protein CFI10_09290 [Marinobacterium iners]|uniref:hypothetical protein n=1 Tax=Marinobacterium iners TaxID=48076 RepID=UPI001A8F52F1|nr:hypothetical protein [Marinobacterium iners]QSR35181.1 hypothetical protein CFI10_09245 [Marinobacterium iners]QSR35189.1 hypothetical protein CFI10_09290 [Marinobacterium iners]